MSVFLENSKEYLKTNMRFLLFLYDIDENGFDSIYQILKLFDNNPNNPTLHNFIRNELIPKSIIKKTYTKGFFGKTKEIYSIDEDKLIRFVQANILDNLCWDMSQGFKSTSMMKPNPI